MDGVQTARHTDRAGNERRVASLKPSPAILIPFSELTWHLKSALSEPAAVSPLSPNLGDVIFGKQ